ncbi:hypothetical protein P9112_004836 [Eukaryota sp. TZLM1-RC]
MSNRFDTLLCQALHHCLRAYLVESFEEYLEDYEENLPSSFLKSPTTLDRIARYRSLVLILREVEKINPEVDLNNHRVVEFRKYLSKLIFGAHDVFVVTASELESKAIEEEKRRCVSFVENLPESHLFSIEPLPFRRTLSFKEVEAIRSNLVSQFNVESFKPFSEHSQWYPIVEERPPFTEAFNMVDFATFIGIDQLMNFLIILNCDRLYVVRDFGNSHYELDTSIFDAAYSAIDGGECYATDYDFTFLIYVSSEATITISGKELLEQVEFHWSDWSDYAYQ